MSTDNLTEISWWTVKSPKNSQTKNQNKCLLLLKITIKNQFVQIQWSKIIKVSLIPKLTHKLNLFQWPKADFKIMTLPSPDYPVTPLLEQSKKEKTRQIKFIWMVQFQSQSNNLFLSWKNNEIKFTWGKALSSKSQRDNLFLSPNLHHNVQQLLWSRFLTRITALRIWVMSVHLLERLLTWLLKKDLPHQFLLTHKNHLLIKSIINKTNKIVTLNPVNIHSNAPWNERTVLIIWDTEQLKMQTQSLKLPNNKNIFKTGIKKKPMNKKFNKIIILTIKTIKMINVTIIIRLKEISNKDSIKEMH